MKFKKTKRGFKYIEGKDKYGDVFSIQESSLATDSCIWFGLDGEPKKHLTVTGGWLGQKMYLSKKQLKNDIIPILQFFVKNDRLPGCIKELKEKEEGR